MMKNEIICCECAFVGYSVDDLKEIQAGFFMCKDCEKGFFKKNIQWKRIDKEQPKNAGHYLTCIDFMGVIEKGEFNGVNKWHTCFGCPTHWMELPDPPEFDDAISDHDTQESSEEELREILLQKSIKELQDCMQEVYKSFDVFKSIFFTKKRANHGK